MSSALSSFVATHINKVTGIKQTASYLHLHPSHPHDIIFEDDGNRVSASWGKRDRETTRWVCETGTEGQLGDSLLLEHRVLGLENFALKCKETRKLQWTKHQPFSQLTAATWFGPIYLSLLLNLTWLLICILNCQISSKCCISGKIKSRASGLFSTVLLEKDKVHGKKYRQL